MYSIWKLPKHALGLGFGLDLPTMTFSQFPVWVTLLSGATCFVQAHQPRLILNVPLVHCAALHLFSFYVRTVDRNQLSFGQATLDHQPQTGWNHRVHVTNKRGRIVEHFLVHFKGDHWATSCAELCLLICGSLRAPVGTDGIVRFSFLAWPSRVVDGFL